MYSRQIPLTDIRQKILRQQDQLGIIQSTQFNTTSEESTKLVDYLTSIQVNCDINTPREFESLTAAALTTQFFKVWHDHGKITGHGHLLVTIYVPAFSFTSEEMAEKGRQMDVQSIVEQPEIHLLARGGSLDEE